MVFTEQSNCTDTDPEAFFTVEGTSTYPNLLMLKRICGGCDAKAECLDYALKHNVMGYWGNTTEYQRRGLRKQLNIIPRELYQDY
jgi:WhiB family transcriptional regulator, redox-sensing transcriptional regulator